MGRVLFRPTLWLRNINEKQLLIMFNGTGCTDVCIMLEFVHSFIHS